MEQSRLAILDLDARANQPMVFTDWRYTVVFNDEIYNFCELRRTLEEDGESFRSHGDTKVFLAAYREWGTDCLSCLNSMFTSALYDGR